MKTQATVVITGDPIEGLTIYGPFTDVFEAIEWGENYLGIDWWTYVLEPPEFD